MTTALVPMSDIEKMGTAIAKSGLFGMKTPEQAIALMLIAQAEGMHPAIAARDYHVIQGRPALKADAMLARFQAAGGKVEFLKYEDTEVKAVFSHPQGGSITLSWTLEQAKRIGLANKDNWKNYSRAMLRARVVSEGIRTVYPGCIVGVYTPEEVSDFDPPKLPREKNLGAAEVVSEPIDDAKPLGETALDIAPAPDQWLLNIPGKEMILFDSKEEWIAGLLQLVDKVANSKMDNPTKHEKIKILKEANTENFKRIGLVDSANIYRTIAQKVSREDDNAKKSSPETEEWAREFQAQMDKTE